MARDWRCGSLVSLQRTLADLPMGPAGRDGDSGQVFSLTLQGITCPKECGECLTSLGGRGLAGLSALTLHGCALRAEHLPELARALHSVSSPCEQRQAADTAEEECCCDLDTFGDPADVSEVQAHVNVAAVSLQLQEGQYRVAKSMAQAGAALVLRMLAIVRCPDVRTDAWPLIWRELPCTLLEVDLTGDKLSDHAVSALCGAFGRGCRPRRLVLQGNRCKDVERLAGLISEGTLQELDLSDNLLNDKSAMQLAEALEAPAAGLQRLVLSRNSRLTSAGFGRLAARLPRGPLRHLAVDGTALCDVGVAELARVATLDPSWSCWLGVELLLQATRVSSAGARLLLEAARARPLLGALVVDEGGERVRWRRICDPEDIFHLGG